MGKSFSGGATHEKNISMLTPEQQTMLSQIVTGLGPQYQQALSGFLQPQSQEESFAEFDKMYGEPAKQAFSQYITPAIQQQYGDANAASSSALNQTLAKSASDLSTSIGSQYGQFQQNKNNQMLQALGLVGPQLFQQTFSPLISQSQGWGGPAIGATGDIMKAIAMFAGSERSIKENIEPYTEGLDAVKKIGVYEYDYKNDDYWPQKHRVGLMADEVPQETIINVNGINHVDFYGILGVLVNAVKELSAKIELLEAK